jgi:UDP-MurNAc hydroxylase
MILYLNFYNIISFFYYSTSISNCKIIEKKLLKMMSSNTTIQFINHASIKICYEDISLLSDPWYGGDAFHKGWNLLIEQSPKEVTNVINSVSHIWLSHEHPDHFSISFFMSFEKQIKKQGVVILFQETKDNRVKNFLTKNGFNFNELKFGQPFVLSNNFQITCIKDGFYDSALFIQTKDTKILNLNDCVVNTESRANEIYRITGECDTLLTQFSYAAWKGGEDNLSWRRLAAKEKLKSIALQVKKFKPKNVIPFASFIYFSNEDNKYLNDSINLPQDVSNMLKNIDVSVYIMKPFDYFDNSNPHKKIQDAKTFWEEKFNNISTNNFNKYITIEVNELQQNFKKYQKRVFENNSKHFIRIGRIFSPIKIFQPVIIRLNDLNKTFILDIFLESLKPTDLSPDLTMSSESFQFILNFPFGFDTLTVNGCFEENNKGGFTKATKSLAIENLNNIGISFRPSIFFNLTIIFMFLNRLKEVAKKNNMNTTLVD